MGHDLVIIGGGLAGSEAAWQAANRGLDVRLFEMRPKRQTGAHQSGYLGELVCSNSLGSTLPDRAGGILMTELRSMGSLLLSIAEQFAVPAGRALAVDRNAFAREIDDRIRRHPRIQIVRREARRVPNGLAIVASGPLTSPRLSKHLSRMTGEDHLYFFDALSPIVEASSIDWSIAFRASRWEQGDDLEGDYVNCPMDEQAYSTFMDALLAAERLPLRSFERAIRGGVRAGSATFFEGCLPIEIIAERGRQSLAFGPMRPVGLEDPRTNRRPHAVVQLRQDDLAEELYNLVGFQTNLTYEAQRSVFRMIPGLQQARFVRYGQMHRNTFINSPRLLDPTLQFRHRSDLFFAGQITGVEGYLGNIATGLLAGVNAARWRRGDELLVLPQTTMLGALCHYVTHADAKSFQPMKANLGLMPPLADGIRRKRRERAQAYAERAHRDLQTVWQAQDEELRIAKENHGNAD
jgi:methylenetetrahydrofolate--tRNA-(uracil-5-)-methyltransferase